MHSPDASYSSLVDKNGKAMKLSEADRENIEVLEALDIDENALFLLLCRYFAYRGKRSTGSFGYPPDEALEATIRYSMHGDELEEAKKRVRDLFYQKLAERHPDSPWLKEKPDELDKTQH